MEVQIECKIEKQLLKNYWNLRIVQNIIFLLENQRHFLRCHREKDMVKFCHGTIVMQGG